jgi:hypothetical protein
MTNAHTHTLASRFVLPVAALAFAACASTRASGTFESPERAMQALAEVAGSGDEQAAEELFGADGIELLRSGDEVADHADALRVRAAIWEQLAFEDAGPHSKVALIGDDAWPFPIPLVEEDGRWRFDVEAGREEIENRRVGRNELFTIAVLHEYVDAQREYFRTSPDGKPRGFARRLVSTQGKQDGLYWPAAEGADESPLGPLVAEAASEGYELEAGEATPFHGYLYRTLTSQGSAAPGGKRDFTDENGLMSRGCALLAWPAKYGSSGVMTFQVSHRGIVYQKDLGPDTEQAVRAIQAFDPDVSWTPTAD